MDSSTRYRAHAHSAAETWHHCSWGARRQSTSNDILTYFHRLAVFTYLAQLSTQQNTNASASDHRHQAIRAVNITLDFDSHDMADEGTRAGVAGRACSQVAITTLLLFIGLLVSSWYAGQLLQEIQTTLTATAMEAARGTNANAGGDNSRLSPNHRRLPIPLHELTADDPNLVCPEPLVAVHDRIVSGTANATTARNDQTKSRQRIPRIMHLSMRSRCMPPDLADTVFRWQKALPNHDIYFHDDAAIERLMRDDPWPEFPHLLKIYDGCIQVKGAVMVDIWRILVLYRYGGLYSDIDNWPLQPFTEDEPIQQDDSAMFFSDPFNRPSQWFMSMEPKHPITYFSMFEILKRILAVETIEDFKPVFTTGPDPCKIGYAIFL